MKIQDSSARRRHVGLAFTLLLSILWTAIQMISHQNQSAYNLLAKEFCYSLNLPVAGTEAVRMRSALAYLTSLPHILLAYLLFVKRPALNKAGFFLRCAAVTLVFAASAVVHPKVGTAVFPALRGTFSSASETATLLMNICIIAGLGGTILYFLLSLRRSRKVSFGCSLRRLGFTLVLAFLMAVLYGTVLGILNHFSPDAVSYVIRTFTPDAYLYSGIFSMAVMAPLVEELGYRGMILTKLKKYMPVWPAVLISSALFAVWHRNPGQIAATFFMGILFAWIYLKTGKLRYSMILHSASNLLLTMSMATESSLVPYWKSLVRLRFLLVDIPLGYGILCAVLLIGAIALILWKGFASPAAKDEYVKRA